MRRKGNYVMMKGATPKRVPDDRKFVARYERVPRSRLPLHRKIKRRYRSVPVTERGRGIVPVIKRLLPFRKKATKKIITSSIAKNLTKNLANKALYKALDVMVSLSNRTNNKTIKKH